MQRDRPGRNYPPDAPAGKKNPRSGGYAGNPGSLEKRMEALRCREYPGTDVPGYDVQESFPLQRHHRTEHTFDHEEYGILPGPETIPPHDLGWIAVTLGPEPLPFCF